MLIKLVSYDLQYYALIEKKLGPKFKAKIVLKTDWLDSECNEKLKMKQKSLLAYRKENSTENWQKFCLCHEQLAKFV